MILAHAYKNISDDAFPREIVIAGIFCLLIGFGFPVHAHSADQFVEQCVVTKNGNIIIAADSDGSVIFKDGRITASEGQSVRLLPGTHIRGDESLTVSFVSREYQEAVAEEIAKIEKKHTEESILKRRESASAIFETAFMIRSYGGNGSRSYLSKQTHCYGILPVRTQTSVSETVTANHQKHSSIENNQVNSLIFAACLYQPALSWGLHSATIAVMRT